MSWCWRPSSRRTARCWAWTHATVWTGSSRLPTDKRDHQARCASSAARTGATSPTCGATTIAARPRRHIHHLKSARSAAKRGCGKLLECSMFREAQVVVWRYGKAAEPSTVERKHGRWKAVSAAAAIVVVVVVIGAMLTWHRWDAGQGESDAKTTRAPSTFPSPAALPPAPEPANAAPALPSVGDQPVDPASTGPAEGLLCTHAQLNNTTIANSRSIVHQFEPTTASPRNLFGSSPGSVPLG